LSTTRPRHPALAKVKKSIMTPELKASCELVFQEHKLAASAITWNKNVFRNRMSFGLCDLAKETLVKKNIIYFPKPTKKTITVLNPAVATASSFEEAIAITESETQHSNGEIKKEKTLYDEIYSPEFMEYVDPEIHAPVQNTIIEQSQPEIKLQPGIQEQAQQVLIAEKWHLKPVFYYIVWPLTAAVVSVLVAWLMSQAVEMTYR
jgi:hypothetical protein